MDRSVVILGGYGETGRRVAHLLARRTRAPLVVAGRDEAKASALAEGVSASAPGERVTGLALDVCDPSALRTACEGAALVVNALSGRLPHRAIAETRSEEHTSELQSQR